MMIRAYRAAIATTLEGLEDKAGKRLFAAVHAVGSDKARREMYKNGASSVPVGLVNTLRFDVEYIGGNPHANIESGIIVVVDDGVGPRGDRHDAVLDTCEVLANVLRSGQNWGVNTEKCDIHGITGIRFRTLFDDELDSKGLGLWGVIFRQKLGLLDVTLESLSDFATLNHKHFLVGDEEIAIEGTVSA